MCLQSARAPSNTNKSASSQKTANNFLPVSVSFVMWKHRGQLSYIYMHSKNGVESHEAVPCCSKDPEPTLGNLFSIGALGVDGAHCPVVTVVLPALSQQETVQDPLLTLKLCHDRPVAFNEPWVLGTADWTRLSTIEACLWMLLAFRRLVVSLVCFQMVDPQKACTISKARFPRSLWAWNLHLIRSVTAGRCTNPRVCNAIW